MTKKELEGMVKRGLSIRQIAKEVGTKSPTSIRYWLRKYNLKTKRGVRSKTLKDSTSHRCCFKCFETDIEKFYGNKRSYCSKCHNKDTVERQRKNRARAVEYLGGKCINCGWDKFGSGFDIHHLNPEEKDVAFSSFRSWAWVRIEKEIEKCVLLCKCCHAGVHNNEIELDK